MERDLMASLMEWKGSSLRKPLILKGVRQCGKTWLLKELGRRSFESVAYFNFEEEPQLAQFFRATRDVRRIIQNLSIASGAPIQAGKTLLILDEIQECTEALNSLKYFQENAPELHVACAGSLLGISLSGPPAFPVGKVDLLLLHPMGFTEFLRGIGDRDLADLLAGIDRIEALPELFFTRLTEKLKQYFLIGGMPEAVSIWAESGNISLVQTCLGNLLDGFERDFARHAGSRDFPKLSLLWHSIPSQLARENKKFLYRAAREGARAREYEDALQWLVDAGLVHKVFRTEKPGIPLPAYDDLSAFKLYICDLGLLRRLSALPVSAFSEGNRLFTEFKGSLSENHILQALSAKLETAPRYWTDGRGRAEVDFVIQLGGSVHPVEVKADQNVSSNSLKTYSCKYPESASPCIRFSLQNLRKDGNILNIPLFMADQAPSLVEASLGQG